MYFYFVELFILFLSCTLLCGCTTDYTDHLQKSATFTFMSDSKSFAPDIVDTINRLYEKYKCEIRVIIFMPSNVDLEYRNSVNIKIKDILQKCSAYPESVLVIDSSSTELVRPIVKILPKFTASKEKSIS